MTHPYVTPDPALTDGPTEQSVAEIRAALDALDVLDVADVTVEPAEHQPVRPGVDALTAGRTYAQAADLVAATPDATRTILVLHLNTDASVGAPSYATRNPATGNLLTGLTLDPATLADLDTPPRVTVTIEPGDRLNPAPPGDTHPTAPAPTDVLLAEQTVARAAVAYAATDPDADLTTRMQTALAEAAHVLAGAQTEAGQ
jgi:hypothetical protein